ncbi:MAG: hypothetical protein Q8P18_02500 [Pseudomonadota bacterium]|nr:hypothetical protein [Pseudomonadota bacterium]
MLFCVVDDHLHVVLLCTRDTAGRLAQSLVLALRRVSPVPVRAAEITPVNSRPHMVELLATCSRNPTITGSSLRRRCGRAHASRTSSARVREIGAFRLVEAAAAALGVGPGLIGRTAPVVAARVVVAQLGLQADISPVEIEVALGFTRWAVAHLAERPAPHLAVRATRLRLALEDAVACMPAGMDRVRGRM